MNSLFKVLFIFPSRYLFAIGIQVILSLRTTLRPPSSCDSKQPYSLNACDILQQNSKSIYGTVTLYGSSFQIINFWMRTGQMRQYTTTPFIKHWTDSKVGLLLVHSPLLEESLLLSSPPLSNMLKFRGSSQFNWNRLQCYKKQSFHIYLKYFKSSNISNNQLVSLRSSSNCGTLLNTVNKTGKN